MTIIDSNQPNIKMQPILDSFQSMAQYRNKHRHALVYRQQIRRPNRMYVASFLLIFLIIIFAIFTKKQTKVNHQLFEFVKQSPTQSKKYNNDYSGKYCQSLSKCPDNQMALIHQMIDALIEKPHNHNQTISYPLQLKKEVPFQGNQNLEFKTFQEYLQLFQQQILEMISLNIVKHPKLTSPKIKTQLSFGQALKSLFGQIDPYQNIDHILSLKNHFLWKSDGSYLTLRSDKLIRPFRFNIIGDFQNNKVNFWVMGLRLLPDRSIGYTQILEGVLDQKQNKSYCYKKECQEGYQMLLVIIKPMSIGGFFVEERSFEY